MSGFSPVTWVLARTAGAGAAAEAIEGLSEGLKFKGIVPTKNDLPASSNDGDMYVVEDMDPATPGEQSGKAIWYNAQWNYFEDQNITSVSELNNDAQYLSSKIQSGNYVDNIHVDGSGSPSSNVHEYVIRDIQFKRNVSANYVPKAGEPVFEQNGSTYRLKIGNGSTNYAALPYIGADFTPAVDGRSVQVVGSTLQIYGFNTSQVGTVPKKTATGLEWVKLEDALKLIAGKAIKVTETAASGVKNETIDVLYDDSTVKVNEQNKLYVPIDNETIKIQSGKLAAKKTVAGTGVTVSTNTNNEYVVSGNYKAGSNINLEVKSDGVYINSTAAGGVGVVQAGDGIKVTSVGDKVTVSGDYQAGDYIHINKNAQGKLEIGVDQSAVSNTYRPVKLNGVELLGEEASTGFINYESLVDSATGIAMTGTQEVGGKGIRMDIANMGIIQAAEIGTPHRQLTTLTGRQIVLHAGGADMTNQFH